MVVQGFAGRTLRSTSHPGLNPILPRFIAKNKEKREGKMSPDLLVGANVVHGIRLVVVLPGVLSS